MTGQLARHAHAAHALPSQCVMCLHASHVRCYASHITRHPSTPSLSVPSVNLSTCAGKFCRKSVLRLKSPHRAHNHAELCEFFSMRAHVALGQCVVHTVAAILSTDAFLSTQFSPIAPSISQKSFSKLVYLLTSTSDH